MKGIVEFMRRQYTPKPVSFTVVLMVVVAGAAFFYIGAMRKVTAFGLNEVQFFFGGLLVILVTFQFVLLCGLIMVVACLCENRK